MFTYTRSSKSHLRKATISKQRSKLKLRKILTHISGLKVNQEKAFNGKMRLNVDLGKAST